MSDNSNFGFAKLVPGFDFLQNLAKGATQSIPQMPNLSNWVAPTLNVEELEKRIAELKAVQFWLEQNGRALAATIQALEVQKMTLATLEGMNLSMGELANALKLKTTEAMESGVRRMGEAAEAAANSVSGAADAVAGVARKKAAKQEEGDRSAPEAGDSDRHAREGGGTDRHARERGDTDRHPREGGDPGAAASARPAGIGVDPLQWWGALTSQFQQIAANAMKDVAQKTAADTARNMASGVAKAASAAVKAKSKAPASTRAAAKKAPARKAPARKSRAKKPPEKTTA